MQQKTIDRTRKTARIVSLIWAGLTLVYAAGYIGTLSPTGGALILAIIGFLAIAAMPIALVWALVTLSAHPEPGPDPELTAQIKRLEQSLATQDKRLRKAEVELQRRALPPPEAAPPAAPRAEPTPDPAPEPEAVPVDPQPSLPLEGGSDGGPLSLEDVIQALNFPQDANDRAGFAVLARALASHELARLLQASEDCLNFLAHLGLYMDDLLPAPASAEDWRQFARGGRERAALLPLTGISDPAALETVRGAMRTDTIFRDTALHFQRQFDQMLARVAPEAPDTPLLSLLDTRSGRAFVLLVQVSGMGDAGNGA